ncbi:MAG: OFA family MFS transporter [Flavobacteriaceae bacterium]|nr:OFA family MFS transporter [Flavobacteriaceae bacterium]
MYLNRENSIAKSNYNRWFVPIAALCIHLCIGQIYAFSVFNKPLTKIIGVVEQTPDDWKLTELGWIFTIAIFFLGASAAVLGKWVEKVGPRKTMFYAAICFSSGFLVSAIGIYFHQIWLLYLGSGVLGGIGLGLGYISPVSTLIKWFPDRPGMATGMAIMGFGGGAMIASPLSVHLMEFYESSTSNGVYETFITMGVIYLVIMMIGSIIVRIPSDDWAPKGYDPSTQKKNKLITTHHVLVDKAVKTPQFWLLFMVLGLNVSAGIGVLSQASVMIQEMFNAENIGATAAVTARDAAIFVGLLSLFNMIGRFVWSSLSDYLGRKTTYSIFFILGILLYVLIPFTGNIGSVLLFTIAFSIIISMYGGGFATIPAYLKDMFGNKQIGAIHGRLLLAWSLAAIIGPVTINYLREYQINVLNMPSSDVYNITMYLMAGLLFIGLLCNFFIKPVDSKFHDE